MAYEIDLEDLTSYTSQRLISWIRELFGGVEDPEIRYVEGANDENLLIAESMPYDLKTQEARPAIIIVPGPFRWHDMIKDPPLNTSITRGEHVDSYVDLIRGGLSIHCVGKIKVQSTRIASILMRAFRYLRKSVLVQCNFIELSDIQMSAPKEIVSSDERPLAWFTEVTARIVIQDEWDITRFPAQLNDTLFSDDAVEHESTSGRLYYFTIPLKLTDS